MGFGVLLDSSGQTLPQNFSSRHPGTALQWQRELVWSIPPVLGISFFRWGIYYTTDKPVIY